VTHAATRSSGALGHAATLLDLARENAPRAAPSSALGSALGSALSAARTALSNAALGLALASALAAAPVAAPIAASSSAQPASKFALRLPLATERADGLHAVELTEAVYRAALSADLRDLRIFNARGEALALAPLPAPPKPPAPTVAAPEMTMVPLPAPPQARDRLLNDFALRIEKDGARAVIEFSATTAPPAAAERAAIGGYLIDLRGPHEQHKDRAAPGVLTLGFETSAPDFAGRIQLLASDNLVDWRALAGGVLVRNRQFGDLIERTEIEIPRVPPFIRVSWSGDAAPQLGQARFAPRAAVVPPPLPRATLAVARGEPVNGAVESLYVDVPVGLPITRIRLRVPRDNQVVRVRVWRHDDTGARPRARLGLSARRAPEQWIAEGGARTVFRVDRAGEWVENEPFALSRRSTRLRIDAVDTAFGELPTVEAEWRPGRFAFAAGGPAPYTLAIGLANAAAGPLLETAPLLPADDPAGVTLPLARLVEGAAGAALAAPTAEGSARVAREAGVARYLLWGVLSIAIIVLAAMAWRIGVQLRRSPAQTKAERADAGDASR